MENGKKPERRGGARPGAGRKKVRDEGRIIRLSIAAINKKYGSEEAFFEKIAADSMESFPHLKLLMDYAYGKPTERKEITGADGKPINILPISFIDES